MIGNVWRQHEICFSWLLQQPLLVRKYRALFFQHGFRQGLEGACNLTSIFLISHQFTHPFC